jgi:creatinine amidohydrolase
MEEKPMRLSQITWPKARDYFLNNDTVLLPVGSIECHGRHLPLGTDTLIPDRLLELIEEKSDVLIAPTVPYGACDSLSGFPGTIDLGSDLLYSLLSRITSELYRHGARHFIILNGHGGNMRTIEQVGLDLERKGALLAELNWWLMAWDIDSAWKGGHGGAEETAAIMAVDPSLVDKSEIGGPLELKNVSNELISTGFNTVTFKGVNVVIPRSVTGITENGWIGQDHPAAATEEWGREMLLATADYIVSFIAEFKKAGLKG